MAKKIVDISKAPHPFKAQNLNFASVVNLLEFKYVSYTDSELDYLFKFAIEAKVALDFEITRINNIDHKKFLLKILDEYWDWNRLNVKKGQEVSSGELSLKAVLGDLDPNDRKSIEILNVEGFDFIRELYNINPDETSGSIPLLNRKLLPITLQVESKGTFAKYLKDTLPPTLKKAKFIGAITSIYSLLLEFLERTIDNKNYLYDIDKVEDIDVNLLASHLGWSLIDLIEDKRKLREITRLLKDFYAKSGSNIHIRLLNIIFDTKFEVRNLYSTNYINFQEDRTEGDFKTSRVRLIDTLDKGINLNHLSRVFRSVSPINEVLESLLVEIPDFNTSIKMNVVAFTEEVLE